MQKSMKAVRLSLLYGAALLLMAGYPLSAMAETVDASPASTTTTAPDATQTTSTSTPAGTTPLDSTSSTAPAATTTSTPSSTPTPDDTTKPKETYTYNADTGHWDSNRWVYNPATGAYEHPPEPVQTIQPSSPTTPSTVVVTPNATDPTGAADQQATSTVLNDTTKNAITNAITSGALSGDATVKNNTLAGNATTGDASSAATIINNVNSTVTNTSNQKAATFVSNVMGDVSGDILLQPMLLKAMLEAGVQTPSSGSTTVSTTNQLTNDITLGAQSGNATVSGNTRAGSATTGDANTVADVLNIVNSMVSANQSFVGTINIYGNLDGDILIAPDFIPQMLANNGATTSNASTTASSKDTQSIVNNVALAAASGKAAVMDNTAAGSATTGSANTNIVLFNLTGHDIVASNSLLVFVNVLGKWVGVIVDAPTGATAAAIGNGVVADTTASPDLVINATNNTLLTNNINLTSRSGDALVTGNTHAGGATTGNATASTNIGNIVGTQMGLSGWFGVLFINVFGSWNGSFGIDTSAGNPIVATGGIGPTPPSENSKQPMRVIDFIPHSAVPSKHFLSPTVTLVSGAGGGGYTATDMNSQPTARLAAATHATGAADGDALEAVQTLRPASSQPIFQLPWLGGITFLAGLSLVGAGKLTDTRKRAAQMK
jgi:hypothetical protein